MPNADHPCAPASDHHPSAARRSLTQAPEVSVCIVNWNCREFLRRCLASLSSRLQGVRIEVIVVDNASTDGAADMVTRAFPRVRLVRNASNVGFARGCNQAASLARGQYLFFLNNDTELLPRTLRRLVAYANAHPEIGLLGPRLRDSEGQVQASARHKPTVAALAHRLLLLRWTGLFRSAYRRYRGREVRGKATRPVEVLMGAALLMPRQLWATLGGWDETYTFGGEDIELCHRVSRTHAVVYHPRVEVTHHGRVGSRLRAGWTHTNTLIGITRSLRATGASRMALLAYKTALMVDLPLRASVTAMRWAWAMVRRRQKSARRAWLDLTGMAHFVWHGLGAFWRA